MFVYDKIKKQNSLAQDIKTKNWNIVDLKVIVNKKVIKIDLIRRIYFKLRWVRSWQVRQ